MEAMASAKRLLIFKVLLWSAAFSATAGAGTLPGEPEFSVFVNDYQYGPEMLGLTPVEGSSLYQTFGAVSEGDVGFGWDLSVDPDPLIGGGFSVTNQTNSTQTYSVMFDLGVNSPFAPALQRGEVTYSLSDSSGVGIADGAASVSNLEWSGVIDGTRSLNLALIDANCFGMGCTIGFGPIAEAFQLYQLGVNSSIGIELTFDLSAGDRLDVNTLFEVVPVPLPAGLWMLFSGAALLLPFARNRRSTLHAKVRAV